MVYAADPKDAAYVVWALRAAGLADVKSGGGVMALLEAGAPVETGPGGRRPRSVDDYPGRQAPAKEIAVDLAGLYGGRGNPVQLVDTRAAAAEAIHLAARRTHVVEGNALVHGDGWNARLAVNKALRPLGSETAVVYGDDVRDAALVWWGLASEGKKAQLFMDGFALWQASGLPTQANGAPAAAQPSGMRVGGGCG